MIDKALAIAASNAEVAEMVIKERDELRAQLAELRERLSQEPPTFECQSCGAKVLSNG